MKKSTKKQLIIYLTLCFGVLAFSLLGIVSLGRGKTELSEVSFSLLALFITSLFLFLKTKEN